MHAKWMEASSEILEANFNPRVAVPEAEDYLVQASRSAREARTALGEQARFDVRYGDAPKQVLDVIGQGDGKAPVVVFFHGGYWRALDKDDHTQVALPFADAGAVFLNVNYDLCPAVTLDQLVSQCRQSVVWAARHAIEAGGDPRRIFLYGHSAGAHIAAMMMGETFAADELAEGAIRGIFALSGIYEPEIVLRLAVNQEIGLDRETARRNNVLSRPVHMKPGVLVAVGGTEPEGWQEQSLRFSDHLRAHDVDVTYREPEGFHHFTFLSALADPGTDVVRTMLRQLSR